MYRHTAARRMCASCPELAACREWLAGLAPQDRPVGTVTAGVVVDEVTGANRKMAAVG